MKITTDNTPQGKVTPLGIIPNEWKILPLQKVGKIYSGGTPDTKEPSYWNGDILWCTPSDITKLKTRFITNTHQKITQLGLKNSSATLLPPGCILVCTRATIGNAAITLKETSTNQGFKNIKPIKDINVDWLFYCIASNKHRLVQLGGGSTFLEVSKKDFEKFKIAIPPLPEQQKIAEIISTWDKSIEKQSQLIEKLELRKKGLMQQLLTGKRRLPGFSDSWKKVRFRELFIRVIKTADPLTKYEVLSVTKEGIFPQRSYFNKDIASEDISKYIVVERGDLAMSGLNFWMGSCHILTNFDKGIISPAYKVFKVNKHNSIDFIKNFVQSSMFLQALQGSSVIGASVVRRNLDKEMLYEWTFKIPSIAEQTAIAEVLTADDREIELARQKLELFRQQKHGLMQQLLTGKKRVNINN